MVSRGLLDNPLLLGFMRSPFYPAVLAYPVLVVFSYILNSLLWAPRRPAPTWAPA